MAVPLRVLMVEDTESDADLLLLELRRGGFNVTAERVEKAEALRDALKRAPWDLVLSDYNLPAFDGMSAIKVLKEVNADLPLILVSGTVGEDIAASSVKAGAHDYIMKGNLTRLVPAVERALKDVMERQKHREAEAALRRTEEHMRQLQKLDAIGNLAGGVAHDFNNLLMIMNGYSDVLLTRLGPDDPSRKEIEMIRKTGERAAALTRQLLAFSRRQMLTPRVIDLNRIVAEIEKMLARLIGENIEVRSSLAADLDPVHADPNQVEQVIMNLVVNARDAMPSGGVLTIETANVMLDEDYARKHVSTKPGPHVMLAVSDTGSGMDAATIQRIFEPFFTTKELGKGTGLGLSTVYGIVKQSGGSIWVYSEVGRGSSFKVYFPRSSAGVSELKRESIVIPPTNGTETILLVEDEEGVRDLITQVLQENGYTVLTAPNGIEAIALSAGHSGPIHMLITDVVMPKMSGPEATAKILATRPDLKVLYMSGYTSSTVGQQATIRPVDAFLEKPFSPMLLLQKIRSVLRR